MRPSPLALVLRRVLPTLGKTVALVALVALALWCVSRAATHLFDHDDRLHTDLALAQAAVNVEGRRADSLAVALGEALAEARAADSAAMRAIVRATRAANQVRVVTDTVLLVDSVPTVVPQPVVAALQAARDALEASDSARVQWQRTAEAALAAKVAAVAEAEALRRQNARLAQRVRQLEQRPSRFTTGVAVGAAGAALLLVLGGR